MLFLNKLKVFCLAHNKEKTYCLYPINMKLTLELSKILATKCQICQINDQFLKEKIFPWIFLFYVSRNLSSQVEVQKLGINFQSFFQFLYSFWLTFLGTKCAFYMKLKKVFALFQRDIPMGILRQQTLAYWQFNGRLIVTFKT